MYVDTYVHMYVAYLHIEGKVVSLRDVLWFIFAVGKYDQGVH